MKREFRHPVQIGDRKTIGTVHFSDIFAPVASVINFLVGGDKVYPIFKEWIGVHGDDLLIFEDGIPFCASVVGNVGFVAADVHDDRFIVPTGRFGPFEVKEGKTACGECMLNMSDIAGGDRRWGCTSVFATFFFDWCVFTVRVGIDTSVSRDFAVSAGGVVGVSFPVAFSGNNPLLADEFAFPIHTTVIVVTTISICQNG